MQTVGPHMKKVRIHRINLFLIGLVFALLSFFAALEMKDGWDRHNGLESDGLGAFSYHVSAIFSTLLFIVFGLTTAIMMVLSTRQKKS